MRKSLLLVLSIVCFVGVLATGELNAAAGKKYNDEITLSNDAQVGGQVLKAGEYKVTCEDTSVTFTRLKPTTIGPAEWLASGDKPVVVTAKTSTLPKKADATEIETPAGAGGVHTLTTLRINGSNIEYLFN